MTKQSEQIEANFGIDGPRLTRTDLWLARAGDGWRYERQLGWSGVPSSRLARAWVA